MRLPGQLRRDRALACAPRLVHDELEAITLGGVVVVEEEMRGIGLDGQRIVELERDAVLAVLAVLLR